MLLNLRNLLARLRDILLYALGKRERQELLYQIAIKFVGVDASPNDTAPDEVGCAESVTVILSKVIDFPITQSTWLLNEKLKTDPRFLKITGNPGRGCIIISPTGSGNGKIRGHVGIMANDGHIMASRSADGIWGFYYTLDTWQKYFGETGGMPTYFYGLL